MLMLSVILGFVKEYVTEFWEFSLVAINVDFLITMLRYIHSPGYVSKADGMESKHLTRATYV